ncbi:hypothetical protein BKA62DRAFT_719737 [Auriculariales sp. MPI-PUGE-AT-0066]|nr:hypothetical protein BKA62DRAFT_719737 [Auriculariales sp. MPI-PUGE-AT-0066]
MPGAFLFFVLAFGSLLAPTPTSAVPTDFDLFVDDPTINYFSGPPLSSDLCGADLTFNDNCTGKWWRLDDAAPSDLMTVVTWGPDSGLTLDFTGTGIEMYGRILPDGAGFYAGVDDFKMTVWSTQSEESDSDQMLFRHIGLPYGNHTIRVVYDDDDFSTDADSRKFLGLDYFIVRGFEEEQGDSGTVSKTPRPSATATRGRTDVLGLGDITQLEDPIEEEGKHSLSPAAIGAIIAIVAVAVLLAAGALFAYLRRRRRMRANPTTTTKVDDAVGPATYPFAPQMQVANIAAAPATTNKDFYNDVQVESPVEQPYYYFKQQQQQQQQMNAGPSIATPSRPPRLQSALYPIPPEARGM